jgi:hypothetical protein
VFPTVPSPWFFAVESDVESWDLASTVRLFDGNRNDLTSRPHHELWVEITPRSIKSQLISSLCTTCPRRDWHQKIASLNHGEHYFTKHIFKLQSFSSKFRVLRRRAFRRSQWNPSCKLATRGHARFTSKNRRFSPAKNWVPQARPCVLTREKMGFTSTRVYFWILIVFDIRSIYILHIYTHTYTRVHTDITLHAYTCITTMFNFFGHQAPVTPWYRLHLGRFLRPFRMAIWDKHNWICSILPVFLPRNGSRCLGATSFASWVRVLGAGNWRKSMELPYKSLINQYSPLWCWFSGDVRFSCDMSCWF